MLLKDLLKDIKKNLMVDEQLKAYLYKDRILLIDFTSGFELPEQSINMKDFYGTIGSLLLKDNKISSIENEIIHLITPANQQTIIYLASLIGTEIDDYDQYEKIKTLRESECITI